MYLVYLYGRMNMGLTHLIIAQGRKGQKRFIVFAFPAPLQ